MRVRLLQQVASDGGAAQGDAVKMEALDNVVVDGYVVVRKGAPLTATILVEKKKGKLAPGGQISIGMKDVEMADGERLALYSLESRGGGGPGKKVYAGLVIASLALLSPAGLAAAGMLRGDEIVLPEGTEVWAYAAGDTPLDRAKFAPADGVEETAAAKQPAGSAHLQINTSVEDGSVSVDGTFRGEAPLALEIKRGVHRVEVRRDGYKTWKQRVVVDGDAVKLTVTLAKPEPKPEPKHHSSKEAN